MREAAAAVLRHEPETVVVISPHSPRRPGFFGLWADDRLQGSFDQFGAAEARVGLPNDRHLANAIGAEFQFRGGKTWLIHSQALDHGALVPLWFLAEAGWAGPTVVLGLDCLKAGRLTGLGEAIAIAGTALSRRVAVIASGDMSHRLTPDAPCGFHPQAHEFDEKFIRLVRAGDLRGVEQISPMLRELAAEDVVDSTVIAAAAVKWDGTGHRLLNYEGPFGVGYGVAILSAPASKFSGGKEIKTAPERRAGEALPGLARRAVAAALSDSSELPPVACGTYLNSQRGVFVTLRRRNGELRGCVGTLTPATVNLVEETWRNAVLAAFQDPRFPRVEAEELSDLQFHVSVIHSIEDVVTPEELNPKRYGVTVSAADGRHGLLLPGIESVNTVAEQLHIARMKGGIRSDEPVQIQRFQVDEFVEGVSPWNKTKSRSVQRKGILQ